MYQAVIQYMYMCAFVYGMCIYVLNLFLSIMCMYGFLKIFDGFYIYYYYFK